MLGGLQLERGTPAPNLYDDQLSFVPGVVMDNPPPGLHFGDCILQPPETVGAGARVSVKFISGHLRNNLMLESSFLTVERQEADGWTVVARDSDWETRLGTGCPKILYTVCPKKMTDLPSIILLNLSGFLDDLFLYSLI